MNQDERIRLAREMAASFAVMGQDVQDATIQVMVRELQSLDIADVLAALSLCRRSLRRMTLTDILERLPNGHPPSDAAWAEVARGVTDEGVTVVWTEPMRKAFFVAREAASDRVASRMAFKDAYEREVALAMAQGDLKPTWTPSLGSRREDRVAPIMRAVEAGRMLPENAQKLLGHMPEDAADRLIANIAERAKRIEARSES